MRLLIAGWHGQLARALVEVAPSRPEITALAVGRPALDICEPVSIARNLASFRPDVVINTAAWTEVDRAEAEPEACYRLNRDGARLLAHEAARLGAAIIHLSSDHVFDGRKPAPYVEDDATAPLSVYGRSRLDGEAAVARANPRHVIVRTSWMYGPTGRNFVRSMVQRALAGETRLRIVDDHVGTPTYAPHLAEAVLEIARQVATGQASGTDAGSGPWGIHHAAGAGEASWHGLASEVFSVMARHGRAVPAVEAITARDWPTAAARPANARLACGRLERGLGIRLPDWRQGVAACVPRLLDAAGARGA